MSPHAEPDELLDLVDDNDTVVGTAWRSEVRARKLSNFRIVLGFLVNNNGQICIFKRAAHLTAPNSLAVPGGAVKSGETYEQALQRELLEEIYLDITHLPYTRLHVFPPCALGESCRMFKAIFKIHYTGEIRMNPDDFGAYSWLTPQELLTRIEQGEPAFHNFDVVMKKFFIS